MAQNDQKTLTITVPCYNAQDYMEKCLTTLLTGAPRVEIIIIDDGSHDKTGQIADEWASRYPETIRVHHQENGGHGEGINQGLKLATGRYFKVVDSDDWLDETALQKVLDKLDALETTGGVDLMVCNYVYTHADPKDNTTIRYANVFPAGETPVSWNGIRGLNMTQYLTMHACIFSVRVLRECGVVLPKHTFYEDDLFAYAPLPYVKKLCYLDVDLYRYLIGREGQTVSEATMCKNYHHQLVCNRLIFDCANVDELLKTQPKLGKLMYHELVTMCCSSAVFARMNGSPEAEKQLYELLDHIRAAGPVGRRLRSRSLASFLCVPGRFGRALCVNGYRLARRVVSFN